MRRVIQLAKETSESGAGGVFAAVIVKNGEIVGEGVNRVIAEKDPTWHGEVSAIRDACKKLGTHDLSGATMYTAGECCAMCYAAAWWARIGKIYYAATFADARQYGDFDDDVINEAIKQPNDQRKVPCYQILREEILPVWQAFAKNPNRARY
jgi:tRNA(Arg) A34 adenosine deaminase TadA